MRRIPLGARLAAVAVILAAGAIAATTAVGASTGGHQTKTASASSSKIVRAYITYYGWYDNTPPGCATAYSGCAKGKGTYKDPITFASYKKEFPVGTIVYYPTVEKYFVMGDECQECQADWTGKGPDGGPHLYHLDLWIGGKKGNEFDVINCEDGLTQGTPSGAPIVTPLILNPPSNLPVSGEQLFNSSDNHCFGSMKTETSYGRYENKKTGECLADNGDSTKSGSAVVTEPCSSTASDEDLAFDGAFFTVNKLCLETKGAKYGSTLEFATCNGNDREQWEVNSSGTISWIQYLRCITDDSGKIEFGTCKARPDNEWTYTAESAA